jgi:glycine cleavage system H protein
MRTQLYKRATFVTHLPEEHLYTQSHSWLCRAEGLADVWRVGYTLFALRMLGEIVDVQLERKPGEEIEPGDVLGTIEGFKALSDIFCVGRGAFVRANPVLAATVEPLAANPYTEGWIYEFRGAPDPLAMDINGYRNLLDATIDRLLQKERESQAQHE